MWLLTGQIVCRLTSCIKEHYPIQALSIVELQESKALQIGVLVCGSGLNLIRKIPSWWNTNSPQLHSSEWIERPFSFENSINIFVHGIFRQWQSFEIFFATVHHGSINCINDGETCGCESHNDREHKTYNSETLFIIKHED